jgi:hypothetical protein
MPILAGLIAALFLLAGAAPAHALPDCEIECEPVLVAALDAEAAAEFDDAQAAADEAPDDAADEPRDRRTGIIVAIVVLVLVIALAAGGGGSGY